MKRLGIDIGSTTVKVAVIDEEHNRADLPGAPR